MRIVLLACASLLFAGMAVAGPIGFQEISVLVRLQESDSVIFEQVKARRLPQALTEAERNALKQQGASDELLNAISDPKYLLSPEELTAHKQRLAAAKVTAGESEEKVTPENRTREVPLSARKNLIIEKIVITKAPIDPPFFLYFSVSANSGRSEAVYHEPNRTYGGSRFDLSKEIEIPLNLTLRDIEEGDWATVRLHLDNKDDKVTTSEAFEKHVGGKFQMRNKLSYATGRPSHLFMVDKNNFVYQIFWQVQ